ncbi:MAG: HD domain-containing phosphohydrolase, partial [Planctomycetota bacterium]
MILFDVPIPGRPGVPPTTRESANNSAGSLSRSAFQEINVNTLRPNSMLPFLLYTRIEGEYLLYRRENLPFTAVQRNALLENDIDLVYVPGHQIDLYWNYLRSNIKRIIQDSTLGLEDSSAIFYYSFNELARSVVELPLSEESFSTAKNMVEVSTKLHGDGGKDALHSLMAHMETSPTIYSHGLNVCQYGLALAGQVGIDSAADLEGLGIGLFFMDLGMLQMPGHLSQKMGPYSTEEWAIIKRHPTISLEALDSVAGVPDLARMVVVGHHERLDGSGYPRGLSGPQIPLFLRIAAIADTFSSLTTSRPLRPASSTYEALVIMKSE